MQPRKLTRADVVEHLRATRNWGRWGADDQRGTLNLVTQGKRAEAARLVQSGRSVSLSRPWPTEPAPGNPHPAQHFMQRMEKPEGAGAAEDFIGATFHGKTVTHMDALCHAWDADGMWNGRSADAEIHSSGSAWGGIDAWSDGLITRGVLLDVPSHRGASYVSIGQPVHGWELDEIAAAQKTPVGPGDAVVVYSGREAWDREQEAWAGLSERPGLDASCLWFLREHDCAAIIWDMTDRMPNGYDLPFGVHSAISAYGLALIDMALLEPLAEACREEGRWEFMIVVSPLPIRGGTGSPVNPLAIF
jgi:kynurenine formamidase